MSTLILFPIIGTAILIVGWMYVKKLPSKECDDPTYDGLIGERKGGTYT